MNRPQLRRLLVLIPLALLCCATAQARIGETYAECVTRYGKPLEINKELKQAKFQAHSYRLTIRFFDGKAEDIIYEEPLNPQNKESTALQKMFVQHIEEILHANSDVQEWIRLDEPPADIEGQFRPYSGEWRCYKLKLNAVYKGRRLYIYTDAVLERQKQDGVKRLYGL